MGVYLGEYLCFLVGSNRLMGLRLVGLIAVEKIKTLNIFQKLLVAINWMWPSLRITTG